MKPSSAKAKGRRFQQYVRDRLILLAPQEVGHDDVRSTSMGAGGEDLLLSGVARRVYPIAPECKNQERLNIWQAMAQAREHARAEGYTPVLFFTRNRHDAPYACLPMDSLLRLYVELYNLKKEVS